LSDISGLDRRVRRTRFAVQNALIRLMVEKEYEDITVADIVERADIVRSTFYVHYADKDDVLRQGIEQVRRWVESTAPRGTRFAFSEPLYRHTCDVRPTLRAVVARQNWALMQTLFVRVLGELVRDDLHRAHESADDHTIESLVRVVSAAWLSVLTWSLEPGHDLGADEMDRLFRTFALPGVDAVLAAAAR
jgi:AcrR family transcriptional regulator